MNLQIKKFELIEWITHISDINVISRMDKLRRSYLSTTKDNVKPMSIENFYSSIERAEEDIKMGRVLTQEEVEKDSETW